MAGRETTSLLVLILIALPVLVFAIQTLRTEPSRKEDREYKESDYIPLFANTAFPNQNPCEAYSYFDLPFCPPGDPIPNRKKSFEEVIAGDCYMNTGYELRFMKETKKKLLCEKNQKRAEVAKFRDAIAADTASVFRGGSVAIFMFAYGLYFYARANARISMNLIVFLGYNACIF
nr:transmembrane 9 superfamily member 4 [Quercus suber]